MPSEGWTGFSAERTAPEWGRHYRPHETTPENFQLAYISEDDSDAKPAVATALQNLTQLIQPKGQIEPKQVKFLLPEGSGKFVFNYPFVA